MAKLQTIALAAASFALVASLTACGTQETTTPTTTAPADTTAPATTPATPAPAESGAPGGAAPAPSAPSNP